jgi:hypothetical protein
MKVARDDYRGLLNQIAIAYDKNFSEAQSLSLIDVMITTGWQESYRVTVGVTRTGNLPRNAYGHVMALLEEESERKRKSVLSRDEWKVSDEEKATPEEFMLTMKCIGLLCRFENSAELCQKFGEYLDLSVKREHLLESLKKAEVFYSDMFKQGKNVRKNIPEMKLI